jgi:polyhydroxyalkanoate synthase
LFIDENAVREREAAIGKGGILPGAQLAATFNALRANDLVWPYVVNNYLMGGAPAAFDLLYWNADSTNLPGPMYCSYVRNTYLENKLRVPGALRNCGVLVDLGKVDKPAFILATREDHIVPWRAAFRSLGLLGGEKKFVLGASGHIAGVINPAAGRKRSFWLSGIIPKTRTPGWRKRKKSAAAGGPSGRSGWKNSKAARAKRRHRPAVWQYPRSSPPPGRLCKAESKLGERHGRHPSS